MLEEVRVADSSEQGVVVIKTDDGVVGVEDVVTLGRHPVVLRLDVVDRAQQVDFTAVPLLREVNAWRQTRSISVDYVVDQVISEQVCRVDGCEEISRRRASELRRLRRQRPQLSVASKA